MSWPIIRLHRGSRFANDYETAGKEKPRPTVGRKSGSSKRNAVVEQLGEPGPDSIVAAAVQRTLKKVEW